MDTAIQSAAPKKERITSLDALRAFAMLGILLVHVISRFGFSYNVIQLLDPFVLKVNELFLENKCNLIFAVLFGVSFYLILQNPNNSSEKFVWRCFLLMMIGLINKIFFTYDVLMLYGFWGMVLVLFRHLKPKWLILSCICILIIKSCLKGFQLGDMIFGPTVGNRYGIDKSLLDVLVYYPNAVLDYIHVMLNVIPIAALANFLFGYWIAKIGFIGHLKDRLSKRFILNVWAVFIFVFVLDRILERYGIESMKMLSNYSASIAYASTLIYAYYHYKSWNRIMQFFEPYGRLGLTNYSLGSVFGVIFINEFGLGLYKYPLIIIVLFFIAFFLIQAVISYYWLRYFTYGPMEYVWRVATERKKIPFKKQLAD